MPDNDGTVFGKNRHADEPVFMEWDDDTKQAYAPSKENYIESSEEENEFNEFTDALDERLQADVGFALEDSSVDVFSRIYMSDKPNWIRCEQILRAHKALRNVKTSMREHMRKISNVCALPSFIQESQRVRHFLPNAPVHEDCVMPPSWDIEKENSLHNLIMRKVRRSGGEVYTDYIHVAYRVPLISCIYTDIRTGLAHVKIVWESSPGKWRSVIIPRSELLSTRELILAVGNEHKFPINTNNAREMIKYLIDYEAANENLIPIKRLSTQMGWLGNKGSMGFLVGTTHIRKKDRADVAFYSDDAGERSLENCFKKSGTLEGWREAIEPIKRFPAVRLALYASLAAPLLTILKAPNFIIDWSNKTSKGKTTLLSIAASVWGNPEPDSSDGLIASWDMTAVGFERRAAALSHLPLIVDDTKRAKKKYGNESSVPDIVYAIANGQGRTRGNIKGLRATSYWKSIMLTNGEQRIIDFDKSGGTPARVLCMWCSPFKYTSKIIDETISKINSGIFENHGHAGPKYIAHLIRNEENWKQYRDEYNRRRLDINERVKDHLIEIDKKADFGVVNRASSYIACISVAMTLAHEALELDWDEDDFLKSIIPILVSSYGAADREVEAFRDVISWAYRNSDKFIKNEKHKSEGEPHQGWLGFWESDYPNWDSISFFSPALRKILQELGHEPISIIRQWAENEWLLTHGSDTYTSNVNQLEGRPRMIRIKREAIKELGELTDEQASFEFNTKIDVPF